ncbi:carbohydrate ABC transporter permease [Paenibacillus solisilvae]|uniref:Carbohydrate ABC transporter permease n=1 Tax=Paenibacillus solisilvae TaxID=2486751 RepID=A0ABW0VSB1_9BACL
MKVSLWIRTPLTLIMVLLSLCTIFPFYWTFSLSTHSTDEIYSQLPFTLGTHFMENLQTLLIGDWFWSGYFNSFFVAILSTALTVFFSALTGYAFAKFKFNGEKILFTFILATMMIPGQLGLVAFLWQVGHMGWMNTLYPLIVPAIANAFGVFWMRQYIEEAVPEEMLESGRIDGCNEIAIFLRLVIPIVVPAAMSLGLITFIGSWNNYLLPSVLLNDPAKYTLPLVINNLGTFYTRDYGTQFLGLLLGTIPLLVLFIATSKQLIDGITSGSVKG